MEEFQNVLDLLLLLLFGSAKNVDYYLEGHNVKKKKKRLHSV